MKIQLIKTKESDGNWYKVVVDGLTKACIGIRENENKALVRATEIYDFYVKDEGVIEIIKEKEL